MTVGPAGKYSHGHNEDEKPGVIPFGASFASDDHAGDPWTHDQVDRNQRSHFIVIATGLKTRPQ